jgi:hypothetical protein
MTSAFNFETVRLPGGERMGLLGASLLLDQGNQWWLGPAVYGAASGARGGLFVLGAEVQRRFDFAGGSLRAGLFAGGGGGAAAPVGGGLMLRPSVAWWVDLGPVQAGIGAAAVRFPSGDISSRQLSIHLAWEGSFRHAAAERAGLRAGNAGEPGALAAPDGERSGVGTDRLVLGVSRYALSGPGSGERRITLAGARGERGLGGKRLGAASSTALEPIWYWGIETAGAAAGGAAGYMEILATLGHETPIGPGGAFKAGWRGAIGLGGGGGVPTAGGAIAKIAGTASLSLGPLLTLGLESGWLRALDSRLNAPWAQGTLTLALEPARPASLTPAPTASDRPAPPESAATFARTEWTAAIQRSVGAARQDGSTRDLDTMGLKIARFLGEHFYATAQAHSAYSGGAGAYSVGLLGAGLATAPPASPWRAGVEALAGAAGGGGVATNGGAIVQALVWFGRTLPRGSSAAPDVAGEIQWRLGIGSVRAKQPGLSSVLVEVSITRAFAQLVP